MKPSEALNSHRDAIRRVVAARRARNARVFVRNLEIIGEASNNIAKHVWKTIAGDLPNLLARIRNAQASLPPP